MVEDSGSESRGRIKATLLAMRSCGLTMEETAKREESPGGQQGGDVVFCEAEAIVKDSLIRQF